MVASMYEDKVACPECGVENPKSRLTCLVCHEPMRGDARKKKDGEKASKEKDVSKGKKEPEKKDVAKKEPTIAEAAIAATKQSKIEPIKPIKHRRTRRKSKSQSAIQYFKMEGDTLIPINIGLKVTALKKKAAKAEAASLIDLWNRNKSLIK